MTAPRSLVERLRAAGNHDGALDRDDCHKAADRIAALEREVAELKKSDGAFVVETVNLRAQLTLAREQVREQAAKVAEKHMKQKRNLSEYESGFDTAADIIADAIRAMPLEGE